MVVFVSSIANTVLEMRKWTTRRKIKERMGVRQAGMEMATLLSLYFVLSHVLDLVPHPTCHFPRTSFTCDCDLTDSSISICSSRHGMSSTYNEIQFPISLD